MPTCPGCHQHVQYDQLDTHQRYCHGLRGGDRSSPQSLRRLESRIDELDRRVERRLRNVEARVGSKSPPEDGDQAGVTLLEQDG